MSKFLLLCNVIIFFISHSGSNEVKSILYFNNSYVWESMGNHIKRECASFLKEFANATQKFNLCIVKHAKPLRMCEECTGQYSWLLEKNPLGFNSSHCVFDLVRSERFQVVMKVYDFQTGIWKSAHCDKCYQSEWKMTQQAHRFFHKQREVESCFRNFTVIEMNPNATNRSVCDVCNPHYLSLRKIYYEILEETTDNKDEDELCVDIMSLMNDTRRDWTGYNCNKVKQKNYNVLYLSGLFGFLTFIYYAAVRKHEKYKNKIQARSRRAKQVVNYDSE
ncbi:osteopetrosis-associated transmembrane protein 1-like [Dendronephthya gigantea]|uniref:osteopetrosis-associated transmembrane protein 1-like n=1 Tax=Dendronephthya gigantea TaxID=151771 RepID=UPI00106A9805|nr:osteopetrosis-associated transmembrane protein 1-like [Dendronephthya gigantea]